MPLEGETMKRTRSTAALSSILITAALLVGVALPTRALAAHTFNGNNELDGMLGMAVGAHDPTPGGFKLFNEYGYRFSTVSWLNIQVNFSFGDRECLVSPQGGFAGCGSFHGDNLELIGGAKFKFPTRNEKIVPYFKIGGGLDFVFYSPADTNGVALVARSGGGIKIYVLKNLAVGGEMDLTFGPGFFGCGKDCTTAEGYAAFDFATGAEFNF
jgi:hypothetical protein